MVCVCLGTYKSACSVTSVKHIPSINNTNRSLINPIPFNILLQIKLVLFCPESGSPPLVLCLAQVGPVSRAMHAD